ncbi:MAG: hypothetical protein HRO68_09800, partial [Nitrosopumilus sp.]|nr:hypothetical protein [Nitrosopumilus sp.]
FALLWVWSLISVCGPIVTPFSNSCINSYPKEFKVWVDRQYRPTIGATVFVGKTRQKVGDDVFVKMLQTLIDICQKLVPGNLSDAYIVYSVGSWQRTDNFHVKVHLPTAVFLSLTGTFCKGKNPFAEHEDELKKREGNDHRERFLRQVLLMPQEHHMWTKPGKFSVVTVGKWNYPLVCCYRLDGETKTMTTSISIQQLPEALEFLETFLIIEWGSKGFQVGMILSPESSPAPVCFEVAAVVDDREFATHTKKDFRKVKESWCWDEPTREYRKRTRCQGIYSLHGWWFFFGL